MEEVIGSNPICSTIFQITSALAHDSLGYMHSTIDSLTDEIINLGKLSLLYGRTKRAAFHEGGLRSETDTDHAAMVALISCGIAERFYPNLYSGLIAHWLWFMISLKPTLGIPRR